MSAFMIVSVTPHDEEKFCEYESRTLEIVKRHGGAPIARTEQPLVWEADTAPAIGVILQFPDRQAAAAFYHSEEYAPLKHLRQTIADASAVVVESA